MVAYESLKTKEKSSWVIPKVAAVSYGSGHLGDFSLQSLSHRQLKRDFTKVVVTRAGRVRDWSQEEL